MDRQHKGHDLAGIEILRFLCASCVVLAHYYQFFVIGDWRTALLQHRDQIAQALPFYTVLAPVYWHADWAVAAFWTISGFIFYRRYAESVWTRCTSTSEFFVNRFSRLYPLHVATLCIVAALQYLYWTSHGEAFISGNNTPTGFLYHLAFASQWFQQESRSAFNAPIWSVSAEILIYAAFFCIARVFGPGMGIAAASGAFFAALHRLQVPLVDESVLTCGIYFFVGGLAEQLSRRYSILFLPALCVFVGTLVVVAFGIDPPKAVFAVSATIAFARPIYHGPHSVIQRLASLGDATYSSYLIHFPVQLALVTTLDSLGYSRSIFSNPLLFAAYLLLIGGGALCIYHWFEKPAQDRIRAFLLPSLPAAEDSPQGMTGAG